MRKTRIGKSIITFALALIMVFELIPASLLTVFANNTLSNQNSVVYPGGAVGIADRDTSTRYSLSLGDNASTEHAGRIWTDKSVFSDDVSFETYSGGTLTYKLNEGGNLGEDFLVAYSALATSESIEGHTQAPVDVVLILDISGSMSNSDSGMDNGKSRIANTVIEANNAIKAIMELNEYTRVAVVAFSDTAQVLLPLDRYTNTVDIERVWVSTGFFSGYYEEREVVVPIFSVSTENPSNNYSVLYTNAINSKNQTIEKSTNVQGGTNIQMGLYTGMNILATEASTKANINGASAQRVPSVILLSDGSPTYSSDSSAWWAPANNKNDGPGSNPYAGNGMKAILVGSYMKNAIDRNYGVAGTQYDTTVYTVGMGITELPTNEKNLAYMTLDPATYWNTTNTNAMRDTIKGYWISYMNGNSVSINVGKVSGRNYSDDFYTLTHPTANDVTTYDYVDDYYDADNASAVSDVFKEIVSGISVTAPQVPTEIKGGDPITSGYITYTDPIGKYMQVKDVKSIIYSGQEFTQKTKVQNGNVTTYTFSGEVHNPVYGDQEIKNIIITVTEDVNGDETLTIKIPAAVIPLRVNSVTLNADGSVKTHTNNGAFPTRVIYSVGMRDDVVKLDSNGSVYVDQTKLTPEYIAANTSNGKIKFYSNLFTNTNIVHGYSAGDAKVEFEPNHTNSYYYILEDMPIYKDANFSSQVTASEGLNDNTTYYYRDEYYHGNSVEVIAVARTGAQLNKTKIVTGTDGNLYRAAGSPRTNKILDFEGTKVENATNTAEDFYAPTFVYAEGSSDPYEGKFVIYHGNNGVVSLPGGGDLSTTKAVTADAGLTAPDKEFVFTIDLDGQNVNQGTYNYVIVTANGTTVGMGTVSASSPTITLKAGQTATIYSLAPGTTYTVTETQVDGFTADKAIATGTIKAGETSTAAFVNNYSVTPVSYPSSGNFGGTKVIDGRDWGANDKFTFFLAPYNNAPLPTGYNAVNGVTVTAPDVAGERTASFEFGTIEFTAPGTYRYTIYENEPTTEELLPGMTYSRALYRLVVTVADENEDGTLDVIGSDLQKLYTDDATPLFTYGQNNEIVMNQGEEGQDTIVFTNKYSAGSVVRVPVALKDYTDNSGSKPLVSGMFEFKLEALGYILEDTTSLVESKDIPMPEGTVNGVITTHNEGKNITFPGVEFSQSDIPTGSNSITFRYKMTEVVPANNALYGMTYDSVERVINVKISVDSTSHLLKVDATYPNDERLITFKNVYTPDPAVVSINGNKTLNGRDIKSSDNFEFVLEGADASTLAAIADGTVYIPGATKTYVTNGTDGVKAPFAFANIQFKKVGTYTFTVKETVGSAPSVEYDDSVVTVTIVVADDNNDGRLEIKSATYSNGGSAAEFVNNYTVKFDGTPVRLTGTKKLTGKTLLEGEFFFNVVEYYNGTKIGEGLVSHTEDTTADADGAYFGEIKFFENKTYTQAGTYTYYITEQVPNPKVGGTTYDGSQYRFTVVVEDVEKIGKLTVTSKRIEKLNGNNWESVNTIEFVNEYVPTPITATLPLIKKVLTGDRAEALKKDEFEFKLEIVSASTADGIILPATTVVKNGADGSIVFDAIKFTKAGTYTVSVTEVIPDNKAAGIEYSTQKITATYTVVDDRNGVLTAVLSQFVGGEVIINKYNATPTTATIEIAKDFTGRPNDAWLSTDKFDFEVVILDPVTQEAIEKGYIEFPMDSGYIETKTIAAKGDVITGMVTVNRPGTYKFIVREITGNIAGVHYDSQPREITIVATDNSANATIDITINGVATDKHTVTFVNRYNPDSAELSGHNNLTINKEFTGRPEDKWLDTDKFVFKLEAGNNATANAISSGDVVLPGETTLTVSNANKAHPHFGNIKFNAEGKYVFKVTEQEGNISGVTYDTTLRTVTVEVKNDNTLGALVANVVDSESDELIFKNTYKPDSVILSGVANLDIIKVFEGRDWNDNDEFTFVLKPYGQIGEEAIAAGDVVLSTDRITVTKAGLDENNGKTDSFGDILFKKAGTYRLEIVEEVGSLNNVSYDDHRYFVTVTVSDNDQGQLVTEVRYLGSKVFINRYTPDDAKVVIEGKKELSGNRDLGADEFEFVIEAVNVNTPIPQKTTVKNDADGKIVFGEVIYTEAGTYKYKITETVPANKIAGVTYDTEIVEVTVIVEYDAVLGEYKTDVKYTKGGNTGNAFIFENVYKAEKSEPISIPVKKEVDSSEGNSYAFVGGEFEFVIEAITAGAPMPNVTTVTNDKNGNALFEGLVFDEKGEYKYYVTEKAGSLKGMEYDDFKYIVTVTVTDNTAIAKIETSVKISGENSSADEIIFKNKYNPVPALANIFGLKKLEGGYRTIKANDFKFVLEAVTANAPMPINTIVQNDANGRFAFDSITFTKVGVFEYKVSEVDLGVNGFTYDTDTFTVKVIVTDENGELKAVVDGIGSAVDPEIVFVNTYIPDPSNMTIEGTKKLNGRELKENEFEFVLIDADGKEVATAKNDEDGKFEFNVEYNRAGTYTYTIVEKNNALGGVTYDEKVYSVTVEVVDKGGELEVKSFGYKLNGNDVTEVVFTNKYKAASTEVQLEAQKTIKNRELVEGDFVFEIKGEDGKTLKIASNSADGKVVFEKIKLEEAGTFKYTVSEVLGNLDGVIYDTTVYNVVVTVTDDGEGKLHASEPVITNAKSNAVVTKMSFENTYLPPDVPKTGDRRHIPFWFALMFMSGGAAITLMIADKKKKSAKA